MTTEPGKKATEGCFRTTGGSREVSGSERNVKIQPIGIYPTTPFKRGGSHLKKLNGGGNALSIEGVRLPKERMEQKCNLRVLHKGRAGKKMEIKHLGEEFLKEISKTRKSSTMESYRERLERFLIFCEKNKILEIPHLTAKIVRDYQIRLETQSKTNRKTEGLSTNSRYMYLATVKSFCTFLFDRDYLLMDITQVFVLPKWNRKVKKGLTPAEVEQLLERSNEQEPYRSRNQAIIRLYLNEGLKTATIQSLGVVDVDIESGEIRIKKQRRFIKISAQTLKAMKRYLKMRMQLNPGSDWVFIGRGGTGMKKETLRSVLAGVQRNPS